MPLPDQERQIAWSVSVRILQNLESFGGPNITTLKIAG